MAEEETKKKTATKTKLVRTVRDKYTGLIQTIEGKSEIDLDNKEQQLKLKWQREYDKEVEKYRELC